MEKLPYGISNYEQLVKEGYYYVDKTQYIEKLENMSERTIMFLRPRKFGKTLFTSVLENYYDINKANEFETLFGDTYIGKKPTIGKNTYHILRFNFAGIDTSTTESTKIGFQKSIKDSIEKFIKQYSIDFYINSEEEAEWLLKNLLTAFSIQKAKEKIYVIIDEYDHFANELLSFDISNFKNLVSKNGKVRKWYEKLKEGTETVIDRIFITGVAPITLDSLTSGFNIGTDLTMDRRFNCMMGFTKEELEKMMKVQELKPKEREDLFPIMKENYDGYKFSEDAEEKIYNSNMCLYFLSNYVAFKKVPKDLIDTNIASDYSKIGNMLRLYNGEERVEIIKKSLTDEGFVSDITTQFNPAVDFTQTELISMLYYLGYLTLNTDDIRDVKLKVPNEVIKKIYAEYFLKILQEDLEVRIDDNYKEISREMALYGKVDKIVEIMQKYLNNLSNRDFQNFKELDIKIMFLTLSMMLTDYYIKSELEVNRKYLDLLLVPKDETKQYNAILIEFKYLKKANKRLLEETKKQAKEQITEYGNLEEIKEIKKLNKYTIIAINDKLYVDKID